MNAVLRIIDGNIQLSELSTKHLYDFVEYRRLEGRKPQTIKHGVQFIQNGLLIYEVRSVLSHTNINTMMRYAHLENKKVTEKARNVIEMLNDSGR